MKRIFVALSVLSFAIAAFAQEPSNTARTVIVQTGQTKALDDTTKDGAKQSGECSTSNYGACVKAVVDYGQAALLVVGIAQTLQSKKGFKAGGGGAGGLDPSDFDNPNFNVPDFSDLPTIPIDDPGLSQRRNEVIAGLNDLARRGFTIDKDLKNITTPKGKFPTSALSNPKSLVASGILTPQEAAGLEQDLKNAQKAADKMKVVSMGVGGGGAGGGGTTSSPKYVYDDPYKDFFGDKAKPKAPRTSGLTRTLASGEAIGAQTDNIFEMVHRSYQRKSGENIFVGQEGH